MGPIETEIARHAWNAMTCGCGASAEHLPRDLRQLAGFGPLGRPAFVSLENHVWTPVILWEPAPAVTSVTIAAFAHAADPTGRRWLLDLLLSTVVGDGSDVDSHRRGLDLPALCAGIVMRNKAILDEEVQSGRDARTAAVARDVLDAVDGVASERRRIDGRHAANPAQSEIR